jgi:hypothetical protein
MKTLTDLLASMAMTNNQTAQEMREKAAKILIRAQRMEAAATFLNEGQP